MAAAGFRGAVSLAAALAVPQTLASGEQFPDRDLIIFVTAGVIAVTLLVQAPLLPGWCAGPACRTAARPAGSAAWPRRPRSTVVRLRDEGTIDDEVLRGIQTDLDSEEVQIQHRGFGGHPTGQT